MLEGSRSFISGEPNDAGEERLDQVQPSVQEVFRGGRRLYGQVCKVKAVCPHTLSAKGCWCKIWWCRSQKQPDLLMVVTSRSLSSLTTDRLQTPDSYAFFPSKTFSWQWCLSWQ